MPNPGMELGSHSSRSIRIGKESGSNSPVLLVLIIHSVFEVPLVHVQVPGAEKVTRGERDPDRGESKLRDLRQLRQEGFDELKSSQK